MSVLIVDYGMGNLFSVKKILDTLGVSSMISHSAEDIAKAERIILPGVGSFHCAMDNLHKYGLISALHEANQQKKPLWGICLGMQLMAKKSAEGGESQGLGWIDAVVQHLDLGDNLRVPHMGWNNVNVVKSTPLFKSFLEKPTFYFTHSYVMKNNNDADVVAVCDYGKNFPVAIQSNHLFGTQFHPEKSQLNGRILFENFLNWSL